MHPWCKFGDHGSVACRDNADISIFYDVLKVGQGDLGFGDQGLICDQDLHVPVCMFLCLAVTICDTI